MGDNPERLGSEAPFAALCGAGPVEYSSGGRGVPSTQLRGQPAGERRPAPDRVHPAASRPAHSGVLRAPPQRRQDPARNHPLPPVAHRLGIEFRMGNRGRKPAHSLGCC
uniref:hypothetical protein n=1 Tax=Streptomyces endophyticus TaxID=714166 RepID=UPI002DB9F8CC|nr:hypothetical protein [Streptomyces endophyticus]